MTGQCVAQIIVVRDGPSWTDVAIATATIATALTAAAAAVIGLRGVKGNRDDASAARDQEERRARQTRAIHYLERYDAPSHVGARTRFYTLFLIDSLNENERIEAWDDMGYEEQVRAVEGLNFWEELAGMYNRNLVEREIIDDYFGPEAEFIWKRIFWFVEYLRNMQDRDAMLELQLMVRAIRLNREKKGKQIVDGPLKISAAPGPEE